MQSPLDQFPKNTRIARDLKNAGMELFCIGLALPVGHRVHLVTFDEKAAIGELTVDLEVDTPGLFDGSPEGKEISRTRHNILLMGWRTIRQRGLRTAGTK